MRRLAVHAAPTICDTLGSVDLDFIRGHLWAGTCQSCHHPLTGDVPALVVDAMTTRARASLHHPSCRPSQWNDRGTIPIVGGPRLTSTTQAFLLGPADTARLTGAPPDTPRTLAGVLVNPGLEAVDLTRHGPTWTPATPPAYACLGLRGPHRPVDTTAALPGAAARLHGPELTVQLADAAWTTSTTEKVRAATVRERGVVLMLTSAINTHRTPVTRRALHRLIRTGEIALGWIAYTGVPAATTTFSSTANVEPRPSTFRTDVPGPGAHPRRGPPAMLQPRCADTGPAAPDRERLGGGGP